MHKFWIAFDGLMLVHWKKQGKDTILNVIVPEITVHKKRILIDDSYEVPVEAKPYPMKFMNATGGTEPSIAFIPLHFCLDGNKVKPSASASVTCFSFPNLELPVRMYGRRRFITAAQTILNGEKPELLKPTLFPGFTAFCEAIVFEYQADALTLFAPDGAHNVGRTLLVESNLPPADESGHAHHHGSMNDEIANHGEPFNDLLEVEDVDEQGSKVRRKTHLRVAGLDPIECLPFPPDPILGVPESLLAHLDAPSRKRSTSPLDCAPNFLIDG